MARKAPYSMHHTSGGTQIRYYFGYSRDSDDTAKGLTNGTEPLTTGDAKALLITAWNMVHRYGTVHVDDASGFVDEELVSFSKTGKTTKTARIKEIDTSSTPNKIIIDRENLGLKWISDYKGGTLTLVSNTSVTASISSSSWANSGTDIESHKAVYGTKSVTFRIGWAYPSEKNADASGYRTLPNAAGDGGMTWNGIDGVTWSSGSSGSSLYVPNPPPESVLWLSFNSGEHLAYLDLHVSKILGSKTPLTYDPVN